MRKMISVLLAAALVLSLYCCPAAAVSAAYANTRSFMALLDENHISYSVAESTEDNDWLQIINSGEKFDYTIQYFFASDDESVSLRVWNILAFHPADLPRVLRAVNKLNSEYRWCTFLVDETDSTVNAEWDLIVRPDARADEVLLEATIHMVTMVELAHESLAVYSNQ